MRLFAAVEVPPRQLESVQAAVALLKSRLPDARWTVPSSWHVTLRFFGEVPDDRVEELVEAIAGVAEACVPAQSRLLDVGAFPSIRRARVLWVGLDDPQRRLDAVAQGLSVLGARPAEKRSLHPHLTLARFKSPGPVEKELEECRPFTYDRTPFYIHRITLFRSHLSPKGAKYEALKRFEFSP